MPPSPQDVQSSETAVIALALLCLLFGIGSLVFQTLYMKTREKLKLNAPWLFQNLSNKRYISKHKNANKTASIRLAKGKFARLLILDNFSRMSLKKACSIIGLIPKVIIRAIKNFIRHNIHKE